jgi:alpha-galactosidase
MLFLCLCCVYDAYHRAMQQPPHHKHHHHHHKRPHEEKKEEDAHHKARVLKKTQDNAVVDDSKQHRVLYADLVVTSCLLVGFLTFLALFIVSQVSPSSLSHSSSSTTPTTPNTPSGSIVYPQSAFPIVNGIGVTPASYNPSAALTSNGQLNTPYIAPILGFNTWPMFHYNYNETMIGQVMSAMTSTGLGVVYRVFVFDDGWMCAWVTAGNDNNHQPITSIDTYGRMQPDPVKFPSSVTSGGEMVGFAPIAARFHAQGYQFGIHIIGGLNQNAYNANLAFPGSTQTTQQIVMSGAPTCSWCPAPFTFYYLDPTNPNAQVWLNLQFAQYAAWGVDYVKIDCVYGWNYGNVANMAALDQMYRKAVVASGRNIAIEFSPGSSKANNVGANAPSVQITNTKNVSNTYRMQVDLWDVEILAGQSTNSLSYAQTSDPNSWSMVWILSYFGPISIGVSGTVLANSSDLSFPDYDIWPFVGPIVINNDFYAPPRLSQFTYPQQQTIASTWAMLRSPIFIGGDIRSIDPTGLAIALNPYMLKINQYFGNATYVSNDGVGNVKITSQSQAMNVYATLVTNMATSAVSATLSVSDFSSTLSTCLFFNIWTNQLINTTPASSVTVEVVGEGCVFAYITGCH